MTDESHCYQNAIAERMNGILKDEFDLDAIFAGFSAAREAVKNAVCVYNNLRTHWSLDLKTPAIAHQEAA
jgi:transposase InsO family protein